MVGDGLITLEKVEVLAYRGRDRTRRPLTIGNGPTNRPFTAAIAMVSSSRAGIRTSQDTTAPQRRPRGGIIE